MKKKDKTEEEKDKEEDKNKRLKKNIDKGLFSKFVKKKSVLGKTQKKKTTISKRIENKIISNVTKTHQSNHSFSGINIYNIINYLPISKKIVFIILLSI